MDIEIRVICRQGVVRAERSMPWESMRDPFTDIVDKLLEAKEEVVVEVVEGHVGRGKKMKTDEAICQVGEHENAAGNVVNLSMGVMDLAVNAKKIAGAILSPDAAGGKVASLTEAVMGVTAGLMAIAGAIDNLADAIKKDDE